MLVYDDILGIYDTAWCPWDEPGSKIKEAKKKKQWKVKLLGRREKAAGGAKPGDMLFMPPIDQGSSFVRGFAVKLGVRT